MKILAFDQATTTGWCFGSTIIDLRDWETGHFVAPKRPLEGERLILVEDGVLELIDRFKPGLVVHEEPYDPTPDMARAVRAGKEPRTGYNQATIHFLQRVKGAIMMAAARRSIPVEGYLPRSWQSTFKLPMKPPSDAWVTGRDGKPKVDPLWKKKAVMRYVRSLGANVETWDEADAFGICYHACHGKPGMERATGDLFDKVKEAIGGAS